MYKKWYRECLQKGRQNWPKIVSAFSIGMLADRTRAIERTGEHDRKVIIFGCGDVGCKIFAFSQSIQAKGFGIKRFFSVVTTLGLQKPSNTYRIHIGTLVVFVYMVLTLFKILNLKKNKNEGEQKTKLYVLPPHKR